MPKALKHEFNRFLSKETHRPRTPNSLIPRGCTESTKKSYKLTWADTDSSQQVKFLAEQGRGIPVKAAHGISDLHFSF